MDGGGGVNPLSSINDTELHDFLVDPNFDQFINLISGDQSVGDSVSGFDFGAMNSCFIDQNQFGPTPDDELFDDLPDFDSNVADSLPSFDGESIKAGDDDYNDCEDSSSTTMNLGVGRKTKTDRSRTLISERRRRGRMKEKLYALRSLVPNITKMDKASIVGDAALYVQELQSQAKKLKSEIAGLEASLNASERYQETIPKARKSHGGCGHTLPVCKKIIQVDVIQVGEKGFYVRLVSNRGKGVAPSLYKSLESLAGFHVQNSNLSSTSADRYLLTFTLDGTSFEQSLNLPNLKLWITGSLLNQGFEFVTPLSS
ncbi:PREDICTED: transcription factor FER-LIKE IRON DEFICIENCY-INDUCED TRANSCRIPTION FACTOR [Tarenaya hassleriana]|uniref:transcription factor FER-LIKE IRON DEFICIENCY-INDUCED TRANSCRIPTION FACTOR n=1 Tax=Tarenaya hassleriana TaxID=28532 RepID=UPI00053CA117|nr:PREDICTED: transcription factor FER-LIKE IRON DEFICIENCY-INDUCED TRANSCRIPTION FACTOR [Tarenaya hassleriana]